MIQRDGSGPSTRAVMVNHNTSAFAELAIRSLFANNSDYPLDLVVYDNDSNDADLADLQALTRSLGIPFIASGFPIDTANNSHGEILGRFVLDPATRDADYLLFLDSDVCFTHPGVLTQLMAALETDPTAFGAGPVLTWDGEPRSRRETRRSTRADYTPAAPWSATPTCCETSSPTSDSPPAT